MPKTKGAHVRNAVKVLRSNRAQALALLPARLHRYLEEQILPSTWYPLEDHLELLRAIAKSMPGVADPWLIMGRGTAQMDMAGVYRHMVRADSPELTLQSLGAIWRSAHDTGEVVVTLDGARCALVTLRGFVAPAMELCGITTGYVATVLGATNAVGIEVKHTSCCVKGAKECVWRATWVGLSNAEVASATTTAATAAIGKRAER
jgi:hypothetical protein